MLTNMDELGRRRSNRMTLIYCVLCNEDNYVQRKTLENNVSRNVYLFITLFRTNVPSDTETNPRRNGDLSSFLDHRRDKTRNLMYSLRSLKRRTPVILLPAATTNFPGTLKQTTNAPDSRKPHCKAEFRGLVVEQDSVEDGERSTTKTGVRFVSKRRVVKMVFFFLKPTLRYQTFLTMSVGVRRAMSLLLLCSARM